MAITVTGAHAAEDLRALQDWLTDEPELRGRTQLAEPPPEPGHLGSLPELLAVALDSKATLSVLAATVLTWLRYRTSDVSLTVSTEDGSSVTLSAQRARESERTAHEQFVRDLSAMLVTGTAAPADAEPPTSERTRDA